MDSGQFFAIVAITFVILGVMVFVATPVIYSHNINKCRENAEKATVNDIISASAGGFGTRSICIYETSKGKIKESCSYDIGDEIPIGCY